MDNELVDERMAGDIISLALSGTADSSAVS
jgi:hypothetical protein